MGSGGFGSERLAVEWASRSVSIPDMTSSMAARLGASLRSCKSLRLSKAFEFGRSRLKVKSPVLKFYFILYTPCEMQKAKTCFENELLF